MAALKLRRPEVAVAEENSAHVLGKAEQSLQTMSEPLGDLALKRGRRSVAPRPIRGQALSRLRLYTVAVKPLAMSMLAHPTTHDAGADPANPCLACFRLGDAHGRSLV